MASAGISTGGKVFFGGLTAGTFGLGCWQTQRYFEKIHMIEERERELAREPTSDWRSKDAPYHRKVLEGKFWHDKEVLVGPRGAPLCPRQAAGGGMGPSPQGFMVLTPLQMIDGNMVWINRGWVPKGMVPGAEPSRGRGRSSFPQKTAASVEDYVNTWERPTGTVEVVVIRSKPEEPKIIAIDHDYSKRPLQLFWMDSVALQAIAESKEEAILLTQVANTMEESADDDNHHTTYPRLPSLKTIAEFKTTPAIHAGYAATWYGLSIAGVFMTRKLITRGR